MKKNFLNWLTVMLMAFVCVGFAACGGDDDDNGSSAQSNVLVGKWEGSHSESYFEDYTFNSDGTGELDYRDGGIGGTRSFKYKIKNQRTDNGTIYGEVAVEFTKGGSYTWDFKISGGKYLTINGYDCTKL